MTSSEQPPEIEDFSLPASTGQTLSLDSFKGKVPIVLVFLNQENDGDRALLSHLSDRHKDFGSERSQILGVLRVTAREAREIAEDMDLSVPLLADASGAMARDYGVENGDERRVVVVADKQGRLVRRFDPLPVDDEPAEVTEALLYAVRAIGSDALDGETEG